MILCLFKFNIAAHIQLPPEWFLIKFRGQDVLIKCHEKEGADLFSYMGLDFKWLDLTTRPNHEKVEAIVNRENQSSLSRVYYVDKGFSPVYGFADPVKYTSVELLLEIEGIHILKTDNTLNDLKSNIDDILQDFVEKYRFFTREDYILNHRITEAPVVDILIADNYKFPKLEKTTKFSALIRTFGLANSHNLSYAKPALNNSNIELLKKELKTGYEYPLHTKLLLNALKISRINNQHTESIINTETAFEVFLQHELTKICKTRGIGGLMIGRGKGAKVIDYLEAIERGGVKEYLLEYISFFCGQNVKTGNEYRNWLLDVYEIRNDIVHKGLRKAGKEEAEKAVAATFRFIEYILRYL